MLMEIMEKPLTPPTKANMTASNYRHTPIEECGEPLVKLESRPGIRFFDQSRLPPRPRTAGIWLRAGAAEKLYAAGEELLGLTNGKIELYVRDGYRLIECQRLDWELGMRRLLDETRDMDAALAAARILYSNPTGFDENDQSTWAEHTPIHSTGGAVDVFMLSSGNNPGWIYIDGYPDRVAHYDTYYFERKLLSNETLSANEEMVLKNRRLLLCVMERNGFINYPREAWHFDFGDQMWTYVGGKKNAIYGYAKNPEA